MKIRVLGCGGSFGSPLAWERNGNIDINNPHNFRTRSSVLISNNNQNILIDTSPDLREQALRESLKSVDAVLFTHHHADHCHGIDDLRAFCQINKRQIPIYGNQFVIEQLSTKFKYAMVEPKGFWEIPVLKPIVVDKPFKLFDHIITPIPVMHGRGQILGYRIGNLAYITDVSEIPINSMELLDGLSVLLLDCLRIKPHLTHFGLDQSINAAKQINAKKTYFIHMTHDLDYDTLQKNLPKNIFAGYDGLKIKIN